MAEFRSWRSYHQFASEVRQEARFTRSVESQEFLDTVLATSETRVRALAPNRALWRAQLGCSFTYQGDGEDWIEIPCPHPATRMVPLAEKVGDGRANPRRIAYLYTAADRATAIAEVRPWVGAYVTVALFTNPRELRVVDCTADACEDILTWFEEPEPSEREKAVWAFINSAFALPVGPNDDYASYVPTQIIAELFKVHGHDGIIYKSSLGPGLNCCIFDPKAAVELKSRRLHEVKAVTYDAPEAQL